MSEMLPALQAVSVSKCFGRNQVLESVDFEILPGEVHALIGENGAGKSTLLKILFGIHQPSSGSLLSDGKEIHLHTPLDARKHRIAMIHQEPLAFTHMSVFENIIMGNIRNTKAGFIVRKDLEKKVEKILDRLGLQLTLDQKMLGVSVAEQQLVEIGAALLSDAHIIFMDEPTASLTPDEVERLCTIIKKLKAKGKAIVYVSHRLDEIQHLSDRITVLKDGKKVGTYLGSETSKQDMINLMIGCKLEEFVKKGVASHLGEEMFRVENIGIPGIFKDVSFSIKAGEILGVFGLMGSGRTEVARALFGITPISSGRMVMKGKEITIQDPDDAIRHRIALVPEDRQELGILIKQSIAFNTTFSIPHRISSRMGVIDTTKETKIAKELVSPLKTKYSNINQPVGDLSGGNQQKVSLAKWLATEPELLILDEPTRGIDVGAKAEVYKIIGELAAEGKSIIMISSEIEEILGLSDRVMVMYEGRQTAILEHEKISEQSVLAVAHDEGN